MIIQGTHRAYFEATTVIAAFVRDDDGRKDLSGADITATIYLRPGKDVMTLPVEGTAEGRVSFTLEAAEVERQLRPGAYTFRVVADGATVYTGILEMVG